VGIYLIQDRTVFNKRDARLRGHDSVCYNETEKTNSEWIIPLFQKSCHASEGWHPICFLYPSIVDWSY